MNPVCHNQGNQETRLTRGQALIACVIICLSGLVEILAMRLSSHLIQGDSRKIQEDAHSTTLINP